MDEIGHGQPEEVSMYKPWARITACLGVVLAVSISLLSCGDVGDGQEPVAGQPTMAGPPNPPPPGEGETVNFSGLITAVLDEFTPPNFRVGDSITGSYTFDPAVADTDPSPNKGQFPDALIRLSVTVRRNGNETYRGTWGEGSISTDNDDAADPDAPGQVQDQVSMASDDPIDVTPVDGVIPDLVFLQIAQRVSPPAQPTFLMDDAIPTDVSAYNTGELRLGSVALSGNPFGPGFRTIIRFAPAQ